jgi:hypothetical protein
MRSRLPLGVLLVAILLASCGGRPGLTVTIADETVPMVLGSTSEGTACSTSIGDAFPKTLPLTIVRAAPPLALQFEAGQGASEIRGAIYDLAAPAASGGPNEEFSVAGRTGSYETRSLIAGRTYRVLVNVRWSFVVTHGEETHLFEVRLEP